MAFKPNYLTTLVGSVPYLDAESTCSRIAAAIDIPIWPQMVKLNFHENMYTQYGSTLPSIVIDNEGEKITFDTSVDLTPDLENFYSHFIADDVEYFGLPNDYAVGFYRMIDHLKRIPGQWVKGQVTGPISMGLTITDQNLRASLYNEMLADVLVKNAAMNARWQIRQLKTVRPNIIIFVDEPYMASFGSAYISLNQEQVIGMLDEIFEAIHAEGALAGVHCCANTDWSVLLKTQVDILNLDAYGYLENLALYPAELRGFMDRGGIVAWGIVPNNYDIDTISPEGLADRFRNGLGLISERANIRGVEIPPDEFKTHSLITPTCGLGPTTPEIADKVLAFLPKFSQLMRGS